MQLHLPTQIVMSMSVLGFSMYMLYIGKDPGVYLPIITTITGCWLPSPMQHAASQKKVSELMRASGRGQGDGDIEAPLLPAT